MGWASRTTASQAVRWPPALTTRPARYCRSERFFAVYRDPLRFRSGSRTDTPLTREFPLRIPDGSQMWSQSGQNGFCRAVSRGLRPAGSREWPLSSGGPVRRYGTNQPPGQAHTSQRCPRPHALWRARPVAAICLCPGVRVHPSVLSRERLDATTPLDHSTPASLNCANSSAILAGRQ